MKRETPSFFGISEKNAPEEKKISPEAAAVSAGIFSVSGERKKFSPGRKKSSAGKEYFSGERKKIAAEKKFFPAEEKKSSGERATVSAGIFFISALFFCPSCPLFLFTILIIN
jgi:hypothetical protein